VTGSIPVRRSILDIFDDPMKAYAEACQDGAIPWYILIQGCPTCGPLPEFGPFWDFPWGEKWKDAIQPRKDHEP
jgi:hypothetical protein